jgi:hypothetical protein
MAIVIESEMIKDGSNRFNDEYAGPMSHPGFNPA